MKYLVLFCSIFFFFGCGEAEKNSSENTSVSSETEKNILERITKPNYSITLPSEWEETHPSKYQNTAFQQREIQAIFQKIIDSSPIFLVVTKEKVAKNMSSLEFFSATRENTRAAVFDFEEKNTQEIEIGPQKATILHFSARNNPSSQALSFWQLPAMKGKKGVVFTAASVHNAPAKVKEEIEIIFSSIEL